MWWFFRFLAIMSIFSLGALIFFFAAHSSPSLPILPPQAVLEKPTAAPTPPPLPSLQSQLDKQKSIFPHFDRKGRLTPPIDANFTLKWGLKELVSKGILTISLTNSGLLHQARNLAENFRRSGFEGKIFFFCLDSKVMKDLQASGIAAAKIPESWVPPDLSWYLRFNYFARRGDWGHWLYARITHFKALIMYQLLSQGFTVLFCDTDVILPRPGGFDYIAEIFKTHPEIIYQGSIEIPEVYLPPYANSGLYTCRPHPFMIDFFSVLASNQETDGRVDQFLFNEEMDILGIKEGGDLHRFFFFWDGSLFMHGARFFLRKNYTQDTLPYFAHANYLIGGSKEERIKEAGFWFV